MKFCEVHSPERKASLDVPHAGSQSTALASCASADFVFLQRVTRLTNGNLSAHLSKLSDAGLVSIEKRFIDKKPNTHVAITHKGTKSVDMHWSRLEQLRAGARRLVSPGGQTRRQLDCGHRVQHRAVP